MKYEFRNKLIKIAKHTCKSCKEYNYNKCRQCEFYKALNEVFISAT